MAEKLFFEDIEVVLKNIQDLHVRYMETMCDMWPIAIERLALRREGKYKEIETLNEMQIPVLDNAKLLAKHIWSLRLLLQDSYNNDKAIRDMCDERAAKDFVWWINMFVWTDDPRLSSYGLPTKLPLVLYPSQVEVLERVEFCYRNKIPAMVEKSRAEGLTEILCAFTIHHWKYEPGFKATWGSRQEREVDELGNPNTIFGRLRRIIYNLPVAMRPETFASDKSSGANDNRLRIVNPDNEATIIGEGGDNIGRGGRSSLAIIDEKAFVERPVLVDNSLYSNTDCQVDVSTPNGMNHFYEKKMSGKAEIITVWWYRNPSKCKDWRTGERPKNAPWYEYQLQTRDEVVIAQEVDIDYAASVEGLFIKSEWIRAAINFKIPADGAKAAGFDVAGGGKAKSVVITRTGPVVDNPVVIDTSDVIEATWQAVDVADEKGVEHFGYDQNTIGESIMPLFKKAERPIRFRIYGIHGQGKASERYLDAEGKKANEKFRNKRAELWWIMMTRFKKTFQVVNNVQYYPSSELISIPDNTILISQLSAPKMVHTTSGKVGVESKTEMRARNVESPDHADALAYSFSNEDSDAQVLGSFDYTNESTHYKAFDINYERAAGRQYVIIVQTPDMVTSVLGCLWWNSAPDLLLQIYYESVEVNVDPEVIVRKAKFAMRDEWKSVHEWIGNPELFKGIEEGHRTGWYLYKKAKVTLKKNYTDDYRGSIMLTNKMFEHDMVQIHTDCEMTMNQVRTWRMRGGKPEKNLGLAMCLCQLVTRLNVKKEITIQKIEHRPYKGSPRFIRSSVGTKYVGWHKPTPSQEKGKNGRPSISEQVAEEERRDREARQGRVRAGHSARVRENALLSSVAPKDHNSR